MVCMTRGEGGASPARSQGSPLCEMGILSRVGKDKLLVIRKTMVNNSCVKCDLGLNKRLK